MNDIPRPAPMAEKIYAFPVEFRHVARVVFGGTRYINATYNRRGQDAERAAIRHARKPRRPEAEASETVSFKEERLCALPEEYRNMAWIIIGETKYINTAYIPGPYADAYGETANYEAMPGRCATDAL